MELKLENIDYHYKRTDEKFIADDSNYLLEEVAFSLASLWDNVDYSTMVKKESGRFWEDVTSSPYTDLFNQNISAQKIMKAVKIYRFVLTKMNEMAWKAEGRERSIYRYGNSFITHLLCNKLPKALWSDNYADFENIFINTLPALADRYIKALHKTVEKEYPDSMIVYTLRNYTKCRHLKSLIIR